MRKTQIAKSRNEYLQTKAASGALYENISRNDNGAVTPKLECPKQENFLT
jgi:hypothetical protein